MTRLLPLLVALAALLVTIGRAEAQSLGTFRWQLQPFCNVVNVTVTQQGALYQLDGYDDQCGGPQRAPLVGMGTPNPDGSIGFGLNVVTVPGGRGVRIDARFAIATLSGSWTDSAGNSGTFAFGAATGGSPRAAPSTGARTTIPATFALLQDGGFAARGTFGTGNIPASNIGTRMMWHPRKAAFRAGQVTAPLWDDVNIGAHSTAFDLNYGRHRPVQLRRRCGCQRRRHCQRRAGEQRAGHRELQHGTWHHCDRQRGFRRGHGRRIEGRRLCHDHDGVVCGSHGRSRRIVRVRRCVDQRRGHASAAHRDRSVRGAGRRQLLFLHQLAHVARRVCRPPRSQAGVERRAPGFRCQT